MKRKILLIFVLALILNSSFLIHNCQSQWANYTLPYDGLAYTIGFFGVNTGVVCGHSLWDAQSKFYYTTNAGINWIASAYPSTLRATIDVQFINSSLVYACGAENVPFNNLKKYNPVFKNFHGYLKSKFISRGIGEMYSDYKTAFIKSTNAGASWQKVGVFDTLTGYMDNIYFFDANTGYALIDSNPSINTKLYKTINAGLNWQLIRVVESGTQLYDMYFFDMNIGFVSGIGNLGNPNSHGVIFKTTNAGLNWVKIDFNRTSQIEDITFLNSTTGFAVGIMGDGLTSDSIATKIFRTTNGGAQWDSISNFINHYAANIECLPSTGTVFGVGNLVDSVTSEFTKLTTIKTTNFGATWVLKDLNQITFGVGLSLIDQNNFMMCGGDVNSTPMVPRIFKYTNGGNVFINQNDGEVPSSFSLQQNYPNPFNNSSIINFQCAISGKVVLKVYDVMGREVAILVNESLKPGTYEVSFDGSTLNSGVYFYMISAGEFTETKRMLLIK